MKNLFKFKWLLLSFVLSIASINQVWGAASTSTDNKYASGTIDFSSIGTLSAATTYWHNGVKFYSGNSANVSANTSSWSEDISIPAYISNKTASNQANKGKWGKNGNGKQYTMSGFACSQHTIGIHVNQACTITVVVNKNLASDTDDAGITASIDATAYGTAWTSSTYKTAGTALTVTSSREDATNTPGRYTLTIVVTAGNLTNSEAVVKMFNGSSGTGSGKLFCWESITITAAGGGGDVTAPTLSSSSPSNGATGVAVSGNITLTFSENVTINDASKFSISPSAGVTLNTAGATASTNTVTIPYSGLANSTTYTFSTAANAVKDGSNNKNAALSDISFTTVAACTNVGIGTQPTTPVAANVGSACSITGLVASGTNPTYQWQTCNSDGSSASNITSAGSLSFTGYTTATLGLTPTATGATYYKCVVSGDCGDPVTSSVVTVNASAPVYTVIYNVNGGGTVSPASATQASAGASLTLPTPTWSGYTFDGWYNAGTKIGNAGASYTPTANITLYAHWTDNIAGKVFSFIDNNYGDKFKDFKDGNWVTANATGKSKTYTNGTTGVQYVVTSGAWDSKSNAISALAKLVKGTTSMSVVIPTGKIATVKISYNAYGTGDDYRLTVNGSAQANPSTKLADGNTNAQVISNMKEITLSSQTGTLTLSVSGSKNDYIGRVSAVITGYTVTYDKGTYGTGTLAAGTKTAGSAFTLSSSSSAFTRDGYTYDGWSINADGSTKDYNLGGSYTTDAAITLYPHWVSAAPSGYTLTASAEMKMTGTFTGSTTITNGSVSGITSGTTVTDNGDNTYSVGSTTVTAPATIAGTVTVDDSPQTCTWRFDYWNNLPGTVTSNVTNIQAVYKPTFAINYNTNGGTINSGQVDWYEYTNNDEDVVTLPTDVTKGGFTFDTWTQDESEWGGSSAQPYEEITGTYYGAFSLDAQWTPIDYTITHNAATNGSYTVQVADGSPVAVGSSVTANYGQTITLAATPSSGYVFDYWSVTKTSGGAAVAVSNSKASPATFTMPAEAVTVMPHFKQAPNIYYYKDATHYNGSVYKNPEGNAAGTALSSPWSIYSSGITGLTSVVAKGCDCVSSSSYKDAYICLPVNGDKDTKNITITIASNYQATIKMKIGATGTQTPVLTLKPLEDDVLGDAVSYTGTAGGNGGVENGYNEITWTDLPEGVYVLTCTTYTLYISEIDIRPESLTTYNVTYKANGSGEDDVEHSVAKVESNMFTCACYTFTGWNTANDGSGDPYEPGDLVTEDLTLYAQWSQSTYTVSFAVAAGSTGYGTVSPASISSVACGSTVSIASNVLTLKATDVTATPTSNTAQYSYAFTGWSVSNGASITSEQTITASFSRTTIPYTLAWDKNGSGDALSGSYSSGSIANGSSITAPNNPTWSGYRFTGWNSAQDGSGDAPTGTMPAANTTYYAQWTPLYTITNGSPANGTITVASSAAASDVVNISVEANTGYSFSAWNIYKTGTPATTITPAAASAITSFTMPAYSVTVDATFTANRYDVTATLNHTTKASGTTGANAATYGTEYSATFTAADGYLLPSDVTVTIGGVAQSKGTGYTWVVSDGTGTFTVPAAKVTGAIVVTITSAADCPASGSGRTVYKFETKSSGLGTGNVCATASTNYDLTTGDGKPLETLTGGSLTAYTTNTSNLKYATNAISWQNGTAGQLILNLNCALATGDIIRFVNYSSSSGKYNYLRHTSSSTTSNQITLSASQTAGQVQQIVVPSAFNGKDVLYIVAGSNTTAISSVEIIRPYVVTLNANTNGGKVGGENTATIYAGQSDPQVLPHAFKTDYYFNGWFPNASTGEAVANPYTPTATTTLYAQYGDCPSDGTVYKFQVATGLTNGGTGITSLTDLNIGNYLSNLVGGTLEGYASNTNYLSIVGNNAFSFENNGTYLKVTLDCALQAGDKFKSTTANKKFVINKTASTSGAFDLTLGADQETDVPADLVGEKTLYIYRSGSNSPSPTISYFEVYRPERFAVTYHKNDGSATTQVNTVSTVEDNMFTRNGYTFVKWNTQADGNGTDKAVGAAVTAAIDLHAIWECTTPTYGTNLSTTPYEVEQGDDAVTLTVAASANSGTVTYQWYSNTSKSTAGATTLTTGASYNAPTSSIGTLYYYCIATNSTAGCSTTVQSNYATVIVSEAPCFKFSCESQSSSVSSISSGSAITTASWEDGKATLTGGTMKNSGSASLGINKTYGIVLDGSTKEVTVTLGGDNTLAVGSVITLKAGVSDADGSQTSGLVVSGNTCSPASYTSSTAGAAFTQTYTVTALDGLEGSKSFTIAMKSDLTKTYLNGITVTGCATCTPLSELSLSYDNTTLYAYGGSPSTATPNLTGNTGGGAVTWTSSNTDAVTVDASGNITAVGAGTATISAHIAAIDEYCGHVATCNITVPALVTQTIRVGSSNSWNGGGSAAPDMTFNDPTSTLTQNTVIDVTGYTFTKTNSGRTKEGQEDATDKFTGVPSASTKDADKYLYLKFNSPSHNVRIGGVHVPILAVSNDVTVQVTVSDGVTTITSEELVAAQADAGIVRHLNFTFSSTPRVLKSGAIELRIYVYNQSSDKGFRLGTPITISGAVLTDYTYTTSGNWSTAANWNWGKLPLAGDNVVLQKPVTVDNTDAVANNVVIDKSGGNTGKLTIAADGMLIAGGTIRANGDSQTAVEDVVINTSKTSQGALIFDNPAGSKQTKGTVNFYTRSYRDNTSKKLQWQYVGVPFDDVTDEVYGGLYVNKYSETAGSWTVMRYQGDRTINAWDGLALAGDEEGYACLQGTFTSTADKAITLTHSAAAGENLIGNSWTAPIQIADLEAEDFGGAIATIYLFNTGRYKTSEGSGSIDTEGTTEHTAGQWLAIPIEGANWSKWEGMKVIPAFNAFEVITSSEATLSLDYSKVVASATNDVNAEMRAPVRRTSAKDIDGYRLRIADELTYTDMYLFEDITFTTGHDNGWDGDYMPCDGRSAQLYAHTALGKLAVAALPDLEGTVLGFKPGQSTVYTFSFGTNAAGNYYLNDLKMQESTLIQEGNTYTFNWEDGDSTNRFIISASPYKMPTGIENGEWMNGEWMNVKKVLIDDHLYIIRAGKMFNATGGRVK